MPLCVYARCPDVQTVLTDLFLDNMNYREIRNLKKFYSESFPEMSDYETTMLAIETQRNEILAAGLVVYNEQPSVPTGVEKIAMLLKTEEVSDTLLEIKGKLDDINDSLANHE